MFIFSHYPLTHTHTLFACICGNGEQRGFMICLYPQITCYLEWYCWRMPQGKGKIKTAELGLPGVQWLGLQASTTGDTDLIPSRGSKIPSAGECNQTKPQSWLRWQGHRKDIIEAKTWEYKFLLATKGSGSFREEVVKSMMSFLSER